MSSQNTKSKSLKRAKCQRTGKQIPLSEGYLVVNVDTGECSFVCYEAPENMNDYMIQFSRLANSPEALVDWLAHLNGKSWFDPKKFFEFFQRFRAENKLYFGM